MARKALTAKVYIDIDGEKKLWYEVNQNGEVTWYLPKDISERIKNKMLSNIGEHMSEYYSQKLRDIA